MLFIFIDTASNEIYTLSLHDALPIWKTNCSVLIMHQDQIKSPAFQNAELRSERLSILAVLGFVAIFIVVTVVRVFVIRTAPASTPWVCSLPLPALAISYELWLLRSADHTSKA